VKSPKNEGFFAVPDDVAIIAKTLESKGFEAYLVGGCVRDILIGRKPSDWDITTNATPAQIIASFPKTFYENEYGTVGVVNESTTDESTRVVEVTPYRLEAKYSNSRHPDSVTFGTKLEDDLKRRDFTINAIALKVINGSKGHYKGHLKDIYGGLKDISEKSVKTVGKPEERFTEDALRLMRAVRIATDLSFTINTDTERAILLNAEKLRVISKERVRDEFVKIIMSDSPKMGIGLLNKLGLLQFIVPELQKGIGVAQNKAHTFDVWEHSLRTVEHAARKSWPLEVRLAALLHDIGKPQTRRWSSEKKDWTFYGHDVIGAKIAVKVLSMLRFPVKTIEKVAKLVRWHMFFSNTEQITLSAVRRLVSRVGKDDIWDLMSVRICDRIGTGRPKESPYRLRKYKSMIEEVMRDPISVGMLKINGSVIMSKTGLKPGVKIGMILHALLEEVLDDPQRNTVDYLEKRAKELAELNDEDLKALGQKGKETKEKTDQKAINEIRRKYWVK